jgi:hypothetical protein
MIAVNLLVKNLCSLKVCKCLAMSLKYAEDRQVHEGQKKTLHSSGQRFSAIFPADY